MDIYEAGILLGCIYKDNHVVTENYGVHVYAIIDNATKNEN